MNDTEILAILKRFLCPELLERLASPLALARRRRLVELRGLVWSLLLASLATPNRCIADWWRFHCVHACPLAYSSFYARPTPALGRLLERLLEHKLRALRPKMNHWLDGQMRPLEQIFAPDSTTIGLRDALRVHFEACHKMRAALKLHAAINVLSMPPHSLKLS